MIIGQSGLSAAAKAAVRAALPHFRIDFTISRFNHCRSTERSSSAGHSIVATCGGLLEVISAGEALAFKKKIPSQLSKQRIGGMASKLLQKSFNYGEEKEAARLAASSERNVLSKRERTVQMGSEDRAVLWFKCDDFKVETQNLPKE
jgi:hypothetical protein